MRLLSSVAIMGGTAFSCQTGAFANPATGPSNGLLDGSWSAGTVTVSSADQSVTCTASNVSFQLSEDGATLTGNYFLSDLACRGPGAPPSFGALSGAIANGGVVANSFAFDLGATGFHFSGTVSGSAMWGPCSLTLWFAPPTGQATMSGGWTAAPQ